MFSTEDSSEDLNPHIIKTFGEPEISQYGLGYEIFNAMTRFRQRIAQYIVETEEEQTFGELLEDCVRVAINLKADEDLTEEDVLGLCAGTHKHACVPYIAALFIGMKVITFDTSISIEDRVHLFHQVTPKIMFVDQDILPDIVESMDLAEVTIKLVVIGDEADGHLLLADYLVASEEDITDFEPEKLASNKETAALLFSSGTTGLPKGICLPHCGLLSQGILLALSGIFGNSSHPAVMSFTQLYWISSVVFLISTCVSGVARVIMKNFDADALWEIIEKYKVTMLFMSPFNCLDLLKSSKPEGVDTSSLHSLVTGGGSVPEKFIYDLRDIFPGTFILQLYGQTEICGALTMFQTRKIDDQLLLHYKPKSVGRPIPGSWFKVADIDSGKPLGPNEHGELRVKSNFIMNGYYGRDCSEAFDESGWLCTGDIVYYDEYQCFYVIDRIKELLKYRGWHIQPNMLENILASHPAVRRAVVIGIPDEEDGDHPMGLVTLNDTEEDIDPKDLELFVEERVQDRQRLRAGVRIIDHVPTTNTGKIKRRALRDLVINGEI